MGWLKGIAEWIEGDTAFVSVPFTWLLPQAYSRCAWLAAQGYHVRAGGPAVSLLPDYLTVVAECGGHVNALPHHNPDATFTSRGCIRQCSFCAVPMTEGCLVELEDWEPKPVVCDNNLLACSRGHFDRVIDRLKPITGVDFQSWDAPLLTDYHAARLAELDLSVGRIAWDTMTDEPEVMRAIGVLTRAGIPKQQVRCYVLIGCGDTPDDAWYRLETLRAMGIWPNVQRYQPLYALRRNEYVDPNWTDHELKRYCRFWNRKRWLGGVKFEDYQPETAGVN